MGALLLAYLAGALTTLNPCVLPLLPFLVASAFGSGRFGPVALAAGLVTAFTAVGVAISATGAFLGLDTYSLRSLSAVILVIAGIVLLVPLFERSVSGALAPLGNAGANIGQRIGGYGIAGQFGIGLLAGAIWTPCSGPSLVAAFALAAEAGSVATGALRMFVFSLGTATMIALIAFGVRAAADRRSGSLAALSRRAKQIAGAMFVVAGVAIYTGFDKLLETRILDLAPDWYVNLTTSI